jgi:hypothetical protein
MSFLGIGRNLARKSQTLTLFLLYDGISSHGGWEVTLVQTLRPQKRQTKYEDRCQTFFDLFQSPYHTSGSLSEESVFSAKWLPHP